MSINTSRVIGLGAAAGIAAGVAVIATIIAVDEWDLDTRVAEAITRWQMTPDERIALDATKALLAHQNEQRRARRDKTERDKRSKFCHDLLTSVDSELTALTLPQLITEILYARAGFAGGFGIDPQTGQGDYAVRTRWAGHLDALRSEFDRRNAGAGRSLSRLDRLRWQAAYTAVHGFDEPTDTEIQDLTTTCTATAEQPE
ncbi:hypothetical protein [Nocardia sp. NPDC051981]|uniref:hypothetical protein n=1 Tax=Nocardia sp. NPDC051981 TaxID=3155417 RepID=UPI003443C995